MRLAASKPDAAHARPRCLCPQQRRVAREAGAEREHKKSSLVHSITSLAPRHVFETCEDSCMRPSQALASQRNHVLALAAAHGARSVRVFGSVAKGLDREGSDLDLLVDLPAGTSLLRIVGLQLEIEDALGVKVDLCTETELHPDLKTRILAEARPL